MVWSTLTGDATIMMTEPWETPDSSRPWMGHSTSQAQPHHWKKDMEGVLFPEAPPAWRFHDL